MGEHLAAAVDPSQEGKQGREISSILMNLKNYLVEDRFPGPPTQ